MRKTALVLVAILVPAMILSCDISSAGIGINVRIALESTSADSSSIAVRVFVEGSDGIMLNGAVVVCTNPAKEVQLLSFNNDYGCYRGFFDSRLSGTYRVKIKTASNTEPIEKAVYYDILSDEPELSALQDETGASALSGASLQSDKKITLAFSTVALATVYRVQITRGTSIIVSKSSTETTITLDEGTLEPGSYSVQIMAQSVYGDPYFIYADYYAVSSGTGATFLFTVL